MSKQSTQVCMLLAALVAVVYVVHCGTGHEGLMKCLFLSVAVKAGHKSMGKTYAIWMVSSRRASTMYSMYNTEPKTCSVMLCKCVDGVNVSEPPSVFATKCWATVYHLFDSQDHLWIYALMLPVSLVQPWTNTHILVVCCLCIRILSPGWLVGVVPLMIYLLYFGI